MWLQEAARHEWSYNYFLLRLCEEELSSKQEKRCDLNIKQAKFPYIKTLERFDFAYQASINQNQVKDLSKCRWVPLVWEKLTLEERVIVSKRPKSLAKPLKGHLSPFWRFRVGDYRIIADILDDRLIIQVVQVGHRRDIYH